MHNIDAIVQDWEHRNEEGTQHVQAALTQSREITLAKASEIQQLIDILKVSIDNSELDISRIQNSIVEKIQFDLVGIQELNAVIAQYKPITKIPYTVKTNKIQAILKNTQTFIETQFDPLCDLIQNNKSIEGYDFTAVPLVLLGDTSEPFYGSSKQVTFITALIYMFMAARGVNTLEEIKVKTQLNELERTLPWFNVSPFAHTSTIPEAVITQCSHFQQSSFYFAQPEHNRYGFAFFHGTYAFGGDRNDTLDNKHTPKLGEPMDCSSLIAECIGLDAQYTSTASLARYGAPHLRENIVDLFYHCFGIPTTAQLAHLPDHLPAIYKNSQDPQRDIMPGMLWVKKMTKGPGGHTGIVLQAPDASDASLHTIGCNRAMPTIEGIGLEQPPLLPPDGRMHLFFEVNKPQPGFLPTKQCVREYTISGKK